MLCAFGELRCGIFHGSREITPTSSSRILPGVAERRFAPDVPSESVNENGVLFPQSQFGSDTSPNQRSARHMHSALLAF